MIRIDCRLLFATALSTLLAAWAVVAAEAQQTDPKRAVDKSVSPSDAPPAATDKQLESASPKKTQPRATPEPAAAQASVPKLSSDMNSKLVTSLTIFVLAAFVGLEVIAKVPPTLQTPLMSGCNAISGITLVGAVIIAGLGYHFASFMGFLAVIMATISIVGGFAVTHRMLAMFQGKQNR